MSKGGTTRAGRAGLRSTPDSRRRHERARVIQHLFLLLEGSLCFLLSTQMKKVMLTVFKHNHGAYQFFREALQ